ncbi:MAG TPA: hypothetical protein VFM14_02085 [Gemmatimonadales bacterium]|nr:hypothetical protein [Gemmatimonadales bacterium]
MSGGASASVVAPNTSVKFTGTVGPTTMGPFATPFKVKKWSWKRDGAAPIQACLNNPQNQNPAHCDYTPAGSGTMTLEAELQGQLITQTTRVQVNPCPPSNDSTGLLDQPDIRKQIKAQIDSSRPTNAPRYERPGGVIQLADGSRQLFHDAGGNITDCTSTVGNFQTLPSGAQLVFPWIVWHTHPSLYLEAFVTCPQAQGYPPGYFSNQYPGPSGIDSTSFAQLQQQAGTPDVQMWIFSAAGFVFQLDKNHPTPATARMWQFNPNDPAGNYCMTLIG